MERWSEESFKFEGFYGKEGRAKKLPAKGKNGLFQARTSFFVKKGFYQADDFTRAAQEISDGLLRSHS